jgi:sulfatase modifying factor 1
MRLTQRSAWTLVLSLGTLMISTTLLWAAKHPTERATPVPAYNKRALVYRGTQPPKLAKAGDVWVNPVDGSELIYVDAGRFRMGSDDFEDEKPCRSVIQPAFWIARCEVTVAQYKKYCEITGRKMPEAPKTGWLLNSPIINVDWNDALAYAKWANLRLPTEAEWEKAARGRKGQTYPWGNTWDASKCNTGCQGENAPVAVGSNPAGVSPYGVMDLSGNVAEWCADLYAKKGDLTEYRGHRGGSCRGDHADLFRASYRDYLAPGSRSPYLGIRCARSAE